MFITIDGPDGVGKTTIANALVALINEKNSRKAIYTCEPTYSELGQRIRRILRTANSLEVAGLSELFVEDRRAHLEELSVWLETGNIVVCDRYKYSTIVYQQLQGESIDRLIEINSPFREPDYAFILNVKHVDTLISHISKRGLDRDLFETTLTLKKAIELYNSMHKHYSNVIYIDAEQKLNMILSAVLKYIHISL